MEVFVGLVFDVVVVDDDGDVEEVDDVEELCEVVELLPALVMKP